MKKNKFLIALLAALMSCSFAVGFTSCKDDDSSSGGINSESPNGDDTDDESDSGNKDDSDDGSGGDEDCEHDYKETVKKKATCTEDGLKEFKCKECKDTYTEVIPATGHTIENYKCTVCEYEQYSKGLDYALRKDEETGEEYYAVTDKGVCTDLIVIIPTSHNGLPVKEIAAYAFCQSGNGSKNIDVLAFVLPETIEIIGERAFYATEALELVNLSKLPIVKVADIGDSGWNDYGTAGYYVNHICNGQNEAKVVQYENGCIVYDTVRYVLDESGNYTYDEEGNRITEPVKKLVAFLGAKAEDAETFEIVVPEGVQEIGASVFRNTQITGITLPSTLDTIGDYAFANCQDLQEIVVPDSVTSFGKNVFQSCHALESAKLPASLTAIPEYTFNGCENLKKFNIPQTVTTIGQYAFSGTGVEDLELSDTVAFLHDYAFSDCESLARVRVSPALEYFGSYAFANCTALTDLTLPEGLKILGGAAFSGCTALESVTFPSTVVPSALKVFEGCSSLSELKGVKNWENVPGYMFKGTALTDLSAFENVKTIGQFAFAYCYKLNPYLTIPETVTELGSYAFGYNDIVKVTIGGEISNASDVFNYCWRLQEVYNKGTSEFYNNSYWANYAVMDKTINAYSDTEGESKLIVVDDFVFCDVTSRKYISGRYQYVTQTALIAYLGDGEEVVVPNAVTVGEETKTVQTIGAWAFHNNDTVKKITLPAYIEDAMYERIGNCTALETVAFASPEADNELSALSISETFFQACPKLATITLPANRELTVPTFDKREVPNLSTIDYGGTLEGWLTDVTNNGSGAMANGAAFALQGETVSDLVIPESITAIPSYIFRGCTSIRTVELHENVSSIGSNAFYACYNLLEVYNYSTSLTLTAGSTGNGNIATYAKAVYTEETESAITVVGDFVLYNDGEYVSVVSYNGTAQDVVVPEQATKLDLSVFNEDENLVTLTIPKSVKAIIGTLWVENITTVYYEGDVNDWLAMESYGTLGGKKYFNDKEVTKVSIPEGMEIVPENVFYGFTDLKEITIPSSVTEIGARAFYKTAITELVLGDNVASIGASAFCDCEQLETIDFGNVREIGDYAFAGAAALKEAELPSSVKTIGQYAFRNSGIVTLDLNQVESLGLGAFENCYGLKTVTVPETIKSMEGNVFKNCVNLTTIYYNVDGETISGEEGVNGSVETSSFGITTYVVDQYQLEHDALPSRTVIIGANVKRIPNNAFNRERDPVDTGYAWYNYIDVVEFAEDCQVEEIGAYAFKWNPIKEIVIPDTVKKIGYQAFVDTSLEKVTIGNGIEEIGQVAFGYCDNLTEVVFKEGGEVGSVVIKGGTSQGGAFYSCTSLTEITLPASIKTIESYAFQSCSRLQNIVLNEGLEYIGDYAFPGSEYYTKTVTTAGSDNYLPSTLTYIGNSAFIYTDFTGTLVIPEKITEIKNSAFAHCELMTELVIGDNVTTIESYAFGDCHRLVKVTVGESVEVIYNNTKAFKNCLNIVEVYDKSNLRIYYNGSDLNSFGGLWTSTTNVYTPNYGSTKLSTDGNFIYYHRTLTSGTDAGKVWIDVMAYVGNEENVTVPDYTTIDENAVGCTIKGYAFYKCFSVESVYVPDTVTYINYNAFYYCAYLNSLTFEATEGGYWDYTVKTETYNGQSTTNRKLTAEELADPHTLARLANEKNVFFTWNANS
ncbi:MAG: leucine-rich repeat protein [Clostridia bacterium]|nr:leucine-rich repeat protein [Clostridia bacterium]